MTWIPLPVTGFRSPVSDPQPPCRRKEEILNLRNRVVASAFIGLFSFLLFAYLWWGRFEYYGGAILAVTYLGTAGAVLASHLFFRDSLRDMGLRLDNLSQALRQAWLPTLLLAAAIFVWGLQAGRFQPGLDQIPLIYIPWAALQQYILQAFLLRRFQTLTASCRVSVAAAAALFALYHLPNLPLMLASLCGALVWCRLFTRTPNLPVLALSHALLGLLLSGFFKFDGLDQFRVGKGGYPYTIYGDGVQVAAGYDALGQPVIVTLPGLDRSSASHVRVHRPDGTLLHDWIAFPGLGYSGNLAVGELGFGPGDEIAVAPGPGVRNPPHVRIFSLSGEQLGELRLPGFAGYGAWVSVSRGHVIATPGPGPQRSATVFELDPQGRQQQRWDLGDLGLYNSIRAQIFPPPTEAGEQERQLVLWPTYISVNPARVHFFDLGGKPIASWTAFNNDYGMNLAPIRLDRQAFGLVAAPGPVEGHGVHIRVFDLQGDELSGFIAHQEEPVCGATVAAVDLDGDQQDEIVLGGGNCPGVPSDVRILNQQGELLHRWRR